jgi:hypothetical protein
MFQRVFSEYEWRRRECVGMWESRGFRYKYIQAQVWLRASQVFDRCTKKANALFRTDQSPKEERRYEMV